MWVHAHQDDLHVAWPAASVAQHRILVTALRLDYDELSKTAPWLTMIVRRVLANVAPGSTPAKRKAASLTAEGQIRVPGGGAAGVPPQSGLWTSSSQEEKGFEREEGRCQRVLFIIFQRRLGLLFR